MKIRNVRPNEPEQPPRRWRVLLSAPRLGEPAWPDPAWVSPPIPYGTALRRTSRSTPQYQLTADNIHITPPPPWIRSDIKAEVLRDAGLVGTLSVLDDWATLLTSRQRRVRVSSLGRLGRADHPAIAELAGNRAEISPADCRRRIERRWQRCFAADR